MTLIINLWGAPGSGKSTMAAGLFYKLKTKGYNVELSNEYAKQLTYSERKNDLNDQIYIFAKQQSRMNYLANHCDVIISDSPILMGVVYSDQYPSSLHQLMYWSHTKFKTMDFLVSRHYEYKLEGRNQDENEANIIHQKIIAILNKYSLAHSNVSGTEVSLEEITQLVINYLGQ